MNIYLKLMEGFKILVSPAQLQPADIGKNNNVENQWLTIEKFESQVFADKKKCAEFYFCISSSYLIATV